jgi:tRNA-2-methylthio-N6-dimethylallyladenosine synthase
MSLVEAIRYDAAYMFQYSRRPGTIASDMDDQIAKPVVQERFDRLVARQEQISQDRNDDLVDTTVELTVERIASKNDARRATGRTRTNKLVHVPADGLRPGDTVLARVTEARAHYLVGAVPSS